VNAEKPRSPDFQGLAASKAGDAGVILILIAEIQITKYIGKLYVTKPVFSCDVGGLDSVILS